MKNAFFFLTEVPQCGTGINRFLRAFKQEVLGIDVESKEFLYFRKELNKTQKEMAQLLGTSVKALRSYEQGWRSIPGHIERQVIFLVVRKLGAGKQRQPCWVIKECPRKYREKCPAWEFQAGHLCWFVNGTICEGIIQKDWNEKMKMCRDCEVLQSLLNPQGAPLSSER
jgi:hypothetical protein